MGPMFERFRIDFAANCRIQIRVYVSFKKKNSAEKSWPMRLTRNYSTLLRTGKRKATNIGSTWSRNYFDVCRLPLKTAGKPWIVKKSGKLKTSACQKGREKWSKIRWEVDC